MSALIAVSLAACGGSGSSSSAGESTSSAAATIVEKEPGDQSGASVMSQREIKELPPLTVAKQSAQPPRQLVKVDLREGGGPEAKKGDVVDVRYEQIDYPKAIDKSWTTAQGTELKFSLDEVIPGLQQGLAGMKVGGRRELVIPPNLISSTWHPGTGFTKYVDVWTIDLVGVESPAGKKS